ncbi:MAG: Atu2307/SP_0267 family LLM class monooxygenase [Bacteroidota bacterium]
MEIGIDSFAAASPTAQAEDNARLLEELMQRIEVADRVGIDVFSIGEHHRKDFLDEAPYLILAAAAARTKNIKLRSAVTVLSAADPVRVFQQLATLDLLSKGRAEMVAGRGSFTDAFPLFGYSLQDYEQLFEEKLELLLKIREQEIVNWSGNFRAPLREQAIYPRPYQPKVPIWRGVGGTPASFARAGELGLPLMVAIIGGQTHRFRPLVDIYRKAGEQAGFKPEELEVGVHSLGFVAETTEAAKDIFYPGYAKAMNTIGRERGWSPMTRDSFEQQSDDLGALVVGDPKTVAAKIKRHSEALGGITRFSFHMDIGHPSHEHLVQAIELIGQEVKPLVHS